MAGANLQPDFFDALRETFVSAVGVSATTGDLGKIVCEFFRQVLTQRRDRMLITTSDDKLCADVAGHPLDEPGDVFGAPLPALLDRGLKPLGRPAPGSRLVHGPLCEVSGRDGSRLIPAVVGVGQDVRADPVRQYDEMRQPR